jgi:hypothetical protein
MKTNTLIMKIKRPENATRAAKQQPIADLTELCQRLTRTAPEGLLARNPYLVEAAVAGLLFRHGCGDEKPIRRLLGQSLCDLRASVCYFQALDGILANGVFSSNGRPS